MVHCNATHTHTQSNTFLKSQIKPENLAETHKELEDHVEPHIERNQPVSGAVDPSRSSPLYEVVAGYE